MLSNCEKLEKSQVKITLRIPKERFVEAVQEAYQREKKNYNLPGFRKGKAPKKIIENYYGVSVFYETAIDIAFPEIYKKEVEANELETVDRPDVQVEQIGEDKDVIVTATVTVKPDLTLGEYKGLTIEKMDAVVTEDEVQAEMDKHLEKAARFVEITDRPVKDGDQVGLDYSGSVDGVAFDGGTAKDQTLVIGSKTFIPGFEEQMVGIAIGEEKDLEVEFPEGYNAPNLSGKKAVFHVKVNNIKEKVLPEFDNEFVKDISEFDTVEEFKKDITAKLQAKADKNAKNKLSNDAVDAAMANCQVEIPEVMIDNEIGRLIRDLEQRLKYQGMALGTYLQYLNMTINQLKDQYRDEAINFVKARLMMEEMQKVEDVKVSDEMLEEKLKENADEYGKTLEEYKELIGENELEYFKRELLWQATINIIIDSAKIVKAKPKKDDETDEKPKKKPAAKKTAATEEEKPKKTVKKTTKKVEEEK